MLSGRIEDDRHTSGARKFAEFAFRNEERDGRREEGERGIANNNNYTIKRDVREEGRKLKMEGRSR